MTSTIGLFVMIIGGINFAWILLWWLMSASGELGTKLSKKIGTDNENTDQYLEANKKFSKELREKLIVRAVITIIGAIMYYGFK